MDLLYAPSHRQDITYNDLCYTSRGALAQCVHHEGLTTHLTMNGRVTFNPAIKNNGTNKSVGYKIENISFIKKYIKYQIVQFWTNV